MSDMVDANDKSPTPAVSTTTTLKQLGAGFVIITDIVDFSTKSIDEQNAIVRKLWSFTVSHPLMISAGSGNYRFNSTGDGMLITLAYRATLFKPIVDYCVQLIDHMKSPPDPCGVRVGVHIGQFEEFEINYGAGSAETTQMSIGTGCNMCARVSAIGDEGFIVLSEEFVQFWIDRVGPANLGYKLSPKPNDEPIEVRVKHGVPQCVRLVKYSNGPRGFPRKIQSILDVENRIVEILEEIEIDVLLDMFYYSANEDREPTKHDIEKLRDSKSIRVSLFSPALDDTKALECSEFRWHHRSEGTTRSRTKYSFIGRRGGPVGTAFRYERPAFFNDLPKAEDDMGAYEKAIVDRGVPKRVVAGWTRHPRLLLSIPFGIRGSTEGPLGSVCIDCREPAEYADDYLESLGWALCEKYGSELGALWRLRV